jgi:hypothetical protein
MVETFGGAKVPGGATGAGLELAVVTAGVPALTSGEPAFTSGGAGLLETVAPGELLLFVVEVHPAAYASKSMTPEASRIIFFVFIVLPFQINAKEFSVYSRFTLKRLHVV